MPVSAETLRLLMDAGVEGDDLLRIVESIDRTPTKERTANAERQARFRSRKKEAQTVTDNVTSNVTESVTPHARVEDNLKTQETSGQGRKKTVRENLADFVSELSSILDPERVQALIDVRKARGGRLTGNAARLLIGKINECGLSPEKAADTMVLRNWISIEPDWIKRATAPPGKRNHLDATMDILSGRANGSESVFGNHGNVELLPARRVEPRPDDADIRGGIGRRFVAGNG